MLVFPIYAVLVWAAAMHWRRRWPSFALVTAGVLVLVLGQRLVFRFGEHLAPQYRHLFILLVPYTILMGSMGYFICLLPRRVHETECRGCGYDLAGLNPLGLSCPECGAEWRGRGSAHAPKPPELIPIPKGPPKRRRTI